MKEQNMHINALELLVVTQAVVSFAKGEKNIDIQIKTGNRTTVAYVNHLGGTHSNRMNNLVIDLRIWAIQRNCCNWVIHPKIFAPLQEKTGFPHS